jgi:4-hydroxythreonine-4-phosphate dehydrogenase
MEKGESDPVGSAGRARIVITMGDPCGVGPEILVKAFAEEDLYAYCNPVVIGSSLVLRRANDLLGAGLTVREISRLSSHEEADSPNCVQVFSPRKLSPEDLVYGQPSGATCQAVIEYIERAVEAVSNAEADGVCTCPINKAQLHRHGFTFPGHTEFLQELTKASKVVMMLAGPRLRVSLVTIHEALNRVPGLIGPENLSSTIRITGEALLRDFGLESARIGVAGLNPHAGEEGRFGREEIDLIGPVLDSFRDGPYRVSGPYPPDTLFYRAYGGEFDAVVALYHDQGLIPVKLVHFHDAVNVSLGLPIIRTSVDHGTAYDLAGTGRAHTGSLKAAIRLAASMVRNRAAYDSNA